MSEISAPPNWTRTAKFLGLPLLAFVLIQADAYFPLIRFSSDLVNVVVGALSFLLPFLTTIFAFFITKRRLAAIAVTLLLTPLLCLSAFGLFFEGFVLLDTIRTGVNPAFQRIATAPMGAYRVGIFLSDCGAPCSMDIDIRQERAIAPGILVVRELAGFDDADQPAYKLIDKDTLSVSVPPYRDEDPRGVSIPARSRIYHLKPFLYF